MHAPQIIWIALVSVSLALTMQDHGKPKKGRVNFWHSLIGSGIGAWLLWWGGFFGGAA